MKTKILIKKPKKRNLKIFNTILLSRIFLFAILLIPVALIVTVFVKQDIEASWFDPGWGFRQKIPITNASGATQADFQSDITINTSTLISAGKLQASCQDIRFTDQSGKVLPYWIEPTTCNTATTKIWIKVPTITTSGADIYFYYGNVSATSPNYEAQDVFIRDLESAAVSWPLDDTTTTQSYSRVINPAVATGRNIVINGTFDTDTSWTKASGWTIVNGVASHAGSGAGAIYQSVPILIGKAYSVTYTVSGRTGGNILAQMGNGTNGVARTTNGTFTEILIASGNTTLYFAASSAFNGSIDNVSVIQVNLPASGTFTGTELTNNGTFETGNPPTGWAAGGSATLSQQSGTRTGGSGSFVLRVAWNSVPGNSVAVQTLFTRGKTYRVTGYLRSDGVMIPYVADTGNVIFQGTTSTSWQYFDVIRVASTSQIFIGGSNTGLSSYAEFDDISVTEVDPLVGIPTNGVTLGAASGGHLTNAYTFDGTNDNVNIYSSDLNSAFNPSEGTLVLWAKDANLDGANKQIIRLQADNNNYISIYRNGNVLAIIYSANNIQQYVPLSSFSQGSSWFQIGLSWSKSNDQVKIFINGAQYGSAQTGLGTWTGNLGATTSVIGAISSTGTTWPWSGMINDVRLYTRALSSEEIAALYNSGGDRQAYYTENYQGHELIRQYNTSVTAGALAAEEIGSSPIAYWSFDEGQGQIVKDTGSGRNSGTLGAAGTAGADDPIWLTEDQCVSGKCLQFDGSGDYISIGVLKPENPKQAITINAWFKTGINCVDNYECTITGSWLYGTRLSLVPGTNKLLFYVMGSGPTSYSAISSASVNDNKWHYAVGVFDGSNVLLYLDGVLQQTTAVSGTIINDGTYSIGKAGAYSGSYYKGQIDEVKIYSYARTAAQIRSDYIVGAAKIGSSIAAGSQKPFLSDGLVGYWKMDEASWTNNCSTSTVLDASGNGNHGKSCPASTGATTLATGKYGSGGNFDGTDDYVNGGTAASLNITGDITVSAWVKSTKNNAWQGILKKQTTGSYNGYGIVKGISNEYRFNIDNIYVSSNSTYTDTNWHLVTGTRKNGISSIYIDGVFQASVSSPTLTTSAEPVTIGRNYGSYNGEYFGGLIDEARIYNRALSPAEVQQLYYYAPGPIGHWKFDEGSWINDCSTTTVIDSSGYSNNGKSCPSGSGPTLISSGKYGRATVFDATNDYIDASNSNLALGAGDYSIAWWSKYAGAAGTAYPVLSGGNHGDGDGGWYIEHYIHNIAFKVTYGGITQNSAAWTPLPQIVYNTWNHYELVKNTANQTVSVYLNGKLGHTFTGINNVNITDGNLWIGDDARYTTSKQLDDVRIYNYARTPEQVLQDMQASQVGDSGLRLPSPIAYYSMDEQQGQTVNNKGINGSSNNGTLGANSSTGADDPTWKTKSDCKINGCLSFDGGDDVINSGANNTILGSNPFTISAWLKATFTLPYTNYAIGPYFGNAVSSQSAYIGWVGTAQAGTSNSIGGGIYGANYGSGISDNNWHHVVLAYSGGTNGSIILYVDGIAKVTTSVTANIANTAITVGKANTGTAYSYRGLIDEVKIYNVALTPEQIKQDMNAGAVLNIGSTANSEASLLSDGAGNPPIAYWDFDENTGGMANDKSGNNNTGTLTNGTVWSKGKFGSAVKFDGTNDYVSLGTGLNSTFIVPFTVSLWVKPETFSTSFSHIPLIGGYNGINNTKNYLFIQKDTGKVFWDQYPPVDGYMTSNSALALNKWTHIVAIYTNTSRSIYINGRLDKTDNTPEIYSGSAPIVWQIGSRTDANYYFKGLIDEVKIYNYARTSAQIAYDYNRGAPIGWWKMDECEGSTIHDSSGNNLHGQMTITASGGNTNGIGTCNTATSAWGDGATGKYNASIKLDGTGDYVLVSDSQNLAHQTGDLTYGGWFKTATGGGANGQVLLSKGTNNDWLYSSAMVNGQIYCKLFVANNTDGYLQTVTNATYFDNNWHHSLCVVSGNTLSNYIDGKLVATDTTTSGTRDISSAGNLYLGAFYYNGTPSFLWNGLLDDLRIYNYALSADQIKQVFNNSSSVYFGN